MINAVQRPITSGLARSVRRERLVFAASAAVAFLLAAHLTVVHYSSKAIVAQVQACAAGIEPGSDGDLSAPIDRLLASTTDVVAVATLDSAGGLRTIYPDQPAYRRVASAALTANGGPVAMTVEHDASKMRLWGAVAVLGDDPSPTARRGLFIIRNEPYAGLTSVMVAWFVATVAGMLLLSERLFAQKLDQQVARPLARLHRLVHVEAQAPQRSPFAAPVRRKTASSLEHVCDELTRYVTASEARNHGVQLDADRKAKNRETRFKTRLRRAEDRATIDRLTRLRNRTFLEEELSTKLSSQLGGEGIVSFVMLDVDNFKVHNDTHGHRAGDDLLRFVGELLRGSIRPEDFAVRIGGDEFLLALPEVSEVEAKRVAQRIVRMFSQWANSFGGPCPPSLSAGVATSTGDPDSDLHSLIAQADEALYNAKREGKNTVSTTA